MSSTSPVNLNLKSSSQRASLTVTAPSLTSRTSNNSIEEMCEEEASAEDSQVPISMPSIVNKPARYFGHKKYSLPVSHSVSRNLSSARQIHRLSIGRNELYSAAPLIATSADPDEYRASLQPVYEPKHYIANCTPIQFIPLTNSTSSRSGAKFIKHQPCSLPQQEHPTLQQPSVAINLDQQFMIASAAAQHNHSHQHRFDQERAESSRRYSAASLANQAAATAERRTVPARPRRVSIFSLAAASCSTCPPHHHFTSLHNSQTATQQHSPEPIKVTPSQVASSNTKTHSASGYRTRSRRHTLADVNSVR